MSTTQQNLEEFRDHLSTMTDDGGRRWMYPKKPKGKYYTWRTIVAWILLAVLFIVPFLKMNGEPLLLFNVLQRKIIIFGIPFTPQDLHIFAVGMLSLFVFIILFTSVFGRIFCGWLCPQTIFMEMIYRKIEYAIEGDAGAQIKLNKAPWTTQKYVKKISKHLLFVIIAVVIISVLFSYVIGMDALLDVYRDPFGKGRGVFFAILFFSALFYIIFAFVREQVCTNICPYGRLQGVLLNEDSIVVTYDHIRGEPRGKLKKGGSSDLGDCIDCKLCVHACPTGIDIRNGTQLECINCTACMDACDAVMDKIGKPQGLIRYDSDNGIKKGKRTIFTKRALAYVGVFALLLALQVVLLMKRTDVEALFLRSPGTMYQKAGDNAYSNLINFELINKTTHDINDFEIKLVSPEGGKITFSPAKIPPAPVRGISRGTMIIVLNKDKLDSQKTKLEFEVFADGKKVTNETTNFLGPIK